MATSCKALQDEAVALSPLMLFAVCESSRLSISKVLSRIVQSKWVAFCDAYSASFETFAEFSIPSQQQHHQPHPCT